MAVITENNYISDGVTVLYAVTFDYINETDVKVSFDGAETTAFTFDNATTIRLGAAPAVGVAIRIFRRTDVEELPATFFPGSTIQARDLNDNFNVSLYVSQEASRDSAAAGESLPAAIRAEAKADAAVATADAAAADAATALSTATTADANATTALAQSNQAITDSNNALIAAGNALDQVSQAQDSAAAAEASAAAAETAAANAQASADGAVTTANAAQATANAAQTTANTADGKADTAIATANTADTNATAAQTTAAQAEATANAAAAAVGDALLFDSYPNLAALPTGVQGDAAEVTDSTGVESDNRIAGVPAGFVGDPGLLIRLIKGATNWDWQSYSPNDPDNRYLNPTDAAQINSDIATAQATADAALPKSGGTMTGIITFDPAQDFGVQNASTSVRGIVQLSNSVTSTSTTLASTPNATKQSYDAAVNANDAAVVALNAANAAQVTANGASTTANGALQRSGGAMTGTINWANGQNFPVSGIQGGSTTQSGIVQLSTSVTSTSNSTAATSSAVKSAYDRGSQGVASANAATSTANQAAADAAAATAAVANALPLTGGTLTGELTVPGDTSGNRISFNGGLPGTGFRYNGSGNLQMRVNSTTGMEVDSTGMANAPNGIGADHVRLTDGGSSGSPTIRFNDNDTGIYYAPSTGSGALRMTKNGTVQWTLSANSLTFNTGDGDIDSVNNSRGYFLSGRDRGDDDPSEFRAASSSGSNRVLVVRGDGNSNQRFTVFTNGNITAANYTDTSDINLKTKISDARPQWDDIKSLRFVNYEWKEAPGEEMFGLIAQEVQQVSPACATQVGANLGIKTSVLNMKAMKALQEALIRIEELEARLSQLEG